MNALVNILRMVVLKFMSFRKTFLLSRDRTTDARQSPDYRMAVVRSSHDRRTTVAQPTPVRPLHDQHTTDARPTHDRQPTVDQRNRDRHMRRAIDHRFTDATHTHIQYMHTIDALSTHHRHEIGILSTRHYSSNDDRRSTGAPIPLTDALSTHCPRTIDASPTLYTIYQTNESKIKFINPHIIRFFLISGISLRLKIRQIEINN